MRGITNVGPPAARGALNELLTLDLSKVNTPILIKFTFYMMPVVDVKRWESEIEEIEGLYSTLETLTLKFGNVKTEYDDYLSTMVAGKELRILSQRFFIKSFFTGTSIGPVTLHF